MKISTLQISEWGRIKIGWCMFKDFLNRLYWHFFLWGRPWNPPDYSQYVSSDFLKQANKDKSKK